MVKKETVVEQKNIANKSASNTDVMKDNSSIKEPESIMFQTNSIVADVPLECGAKMDKGDVISERIVFECDNLTKTQIDKICRFFEIDKMTAIKRGLWMLHVIKEAEVHNKKIGIISLDTSNVVLDIKPINIV
jgi:predicted component of type VI protein secretion system